ncbi:protein-tyrosine phosphatase [Paraburkholderia sp. BL6665CI2N2]|uniref:arsenate reductase/protein-tyrosine-phosphatase family protein n=1 Tax=Paraburkholderia sp. BL6665CI2N2 TaxID=1938806 RepID=UPI001065D2D6|nr:low molecular weight phosphotyrosine protein phosphatase [Paraburkholderia sp. BL6665CI2N2]TDY16894.1 protein-tyrosine phosphatase [Paraburkholderia sp. BL6665CI2N2]
MMDQILTICAANICRSPMAGGLLQLLLPGSTVVSAGLYAVDGNPIDPTIATLLEGHGVDSNDHRSRRANQKMFEKADLILVMESAHKRAIERKFPQGRGKVFCLDPDEDVSDPYGRPWAIYEQTAARIARHTTEWARRISLL